MLKSALVLAAVASAGAPAAGDGTTTQVGVFVLFSGGAPTLQIHTDARACLLEAPPPSARRGRPVFAVY